jgi:uncharacterized LabA/DUF88 family protein
MYIEIAVEMMKIAPHITHAVLFSGDGDFTSLVQSVKDLGVHVTVVSTIQTRPPMVADELRRRADQFIDLVDLKKHFIRLREDEPRPAKLSLRA